MVGQIYHSKYKEMSYLYIIKNLSLCKEFQCCDFRATRLVSLHCNRPRMNINTNTTKRLWALFFLIETGECYKGWSCSFQGLCGAYGSVVRMPTDSSLQPVPTW